MFESSETTRRPPKRQFSLQVLLAVMAVFAVAFAATRWFDEDLAVASFVILFGGLAYWAMPGEGEQSRQGFWARQFAGQPTREQIYFDIAGGIALPLFCLVLDPVIFQGGAPVDPLLGDYALFAYLVVFTEIVLLALALHVGLQFSANAGAVVGGALIAGAAFSFVLGVVMLPLTLMGMLVIIGFLGLSPFLTTFIYFRNGVRCLKAGRHPSRRALIAVTFLGALVIVAPWVANSWLANPQSTTDFEVVRNLLYAPQIRE